MLRTQRTVLFAAITTVALLFASALGAGATETKRAASGWTRIVNDQFNSGGVPAHWNKYDGRYGSGPENCAAPSQNFVKNGKLTLLMSYRSSGKCGAGWYTGGMKIAERYGAVNQAIRVRFRVVNSDPRNVKAHRNIPMRWVDDPNYESYQGEANYCEGSSLTSCKTFLHYGPSDQKYGIHNVNLSRWNTWRFAHFGDRVRVFLNGRLIWDYRGSSKTLPRAFRRTVLQQECRHSTGCPSASYRGETERIEIDYIQIFNRT